MANSSKRPRPSSPVPPAFPQPSTSTSHPSDPSASAAKVPPEQKRKRPSKRTKLAHLIDGPPTGGGLEFTEEQRRRLEDESAKDEEERRLEEMLFGKRVRPQAGAGKRGVWQDDDDDEGEGEVGESGLGHLEDQDLFFVDEGDLPDPAEDDAEEVEFSGLGPYNPDRDPDLSPSDDEVPPPTPPPAPAALPKPSKSKKPQPAWTDPSDQTLQISLASPSAPNRLRKLRTSASDDIVTGKEYELRLRQQFERLQPVPEWAKPKKSKARRSAAGAEGAEEEEEGLESLLHGTDSLVSPQKSASLPAGELLISRLPDGNLASPSVSPVHSTAFHPTLPVLLTAGADRRLKLFSIDGERNPLLASLHLQELPLTRAQYSPLGTEVLLTGSRPFFYTYDLATGRALRSPKALFGSARQPRVGQGDREGEGMLDLAEYAPDGRMLAVPGQRGVIHLLDTRSGAAGAQEVGTVHSGGSVAALQWTRPGGKELLALGEGGEVYIFDLGMRRCVRRWKDEGAWGGCVMSVSAGGERLAVGGKSGIVSLYDSSAMRYGEGVSGSLVGSAGAGAGLGTMGKQEVLKSVGNLTTGIGCLRFNRSGEVLALSSKERKDQLRIMHVPSNTVFFNWPTSGTPLGHVTSVDFSADSQYTAIANTKGKVLLYQLRHYIH